MASYGELLRHPKWQKMRLLIMFRDKFRCVDCQGDDTTLNVHHLRYKSGAAPWEYDQFDLVTLCEPCHHGRHEQEGRTFVITETEKAVAVAKIAQQLIEWRAAQ